MWLDLLSLHPASPESALQPAAMRPGYCRGIQGENNSCFADTTFMSLFAVTDAFDFLFSSHAPSEPAASPTTPPIPKDPKATETSLRQKIFFQQLICSTIVNPLRTRGYVGMESVLVLRQLIASVIHGAPQVHRSPQYHVDPLQPYHPQQSSGEMEDVSKFLFYLSESVSGGRTSYERQMLLYRLHTTSSPTNRVLGSHQHAASSSTTALQQLKPPVYTPLSTFLSPEVLLPGDATMINRPAPPLTGASCICRLPQQGSIRFLQDLIYEKCPTLLSDRPYIFNVPYRLESGTPAYYGIIPCFYLLSPIDKGLLKLVSIVSYKGAHYTAHLLSPTGCTCSAGSEAPQRPPTASAANAKTVDDLLQKEFTDCLYHKKLVAEIKQMGVENWKRNTSNGFQQSQKGVIVPPVWFHYDSMGCTLNALPDDAVKDVFSSTGIFAPTMSVKDFSFLYALSLTNRSESIDWVCALGTQRFAELLENYSRNPSLGAWRTYSRVVHQPYLYVFVPVVERVSSKSIQTEGAKVTRPPPPTPLNPLNPQTGEQWSPDSYLHALSQTCTPLVHIASPQEAGSSPTGSSSSETQNIDISVSQLLDELTITPDWSECTRKWIELRIHSTSPSTTRSPPLPHPLRNNPVGRNDEPSRCDGPPQRPPLTNSSKGIPQGSNAVPSRPGGGVGGTQGSSSTGPGAMSVITINSNNGAVSKLPPPPPPQQPLLQKGVFPPPRLASQQPPPLVQVNLLNNVTTGGTSQPRVEYKCPTCSKSDFPSKEAFDTHAMDCLIRRCPPHLTAPAPPPKGRMSPQYFGTSVPPPPQQRGLFGCQWCQLSFPSLERMMEHERHCPKK